MAKKKELCAIVPDLPDCTFPVHPFVQRMIDYCVGTPEANEFVFYYSMERRCREYKRGLEIFSHHSVSIGIKCEFGTFLTLNGLSTDELWEKFVNFIEHTVKKQHKMTITTDLEFGQTVYFKNDKEQIPYMVIGVQCDPSGISYRISSCGVEKIVFSMEITTEKAEKATASFKKN